MAETGTGTHTGKQAGADIQAGRQTNKHTIRQAGAHRQAARQAETGRQAGINTATNSTGRQAGHPFIPPALHT